MIYGFGLYGMGGILTDPGELAFSNKVKNLGVNIANSPYRDYDINTIVLEVTKLPIEAKIILWGSSLGANNLPYLAKLINRPIEGIWGFQASSYGMHYPIPGNVKFAHEVYNPSVIETFGLGHYQWVREDSGKTNLYLSQRYDLHPGETAAVQEMFLAEMKRVIEHA